MLYIWRSVLKIIVSLHNYREFQNVTLLFINKLRKNNLTNEVFNYKIGEFIKEYIESLDVSNRFALDIMENQSVVEGDIGFKFYVVGTIKDINGTEINFNSLNTPELKPIRFESHIESMNFKGSPRIKPVKCFTFFSWKFEELKKFKLTLVWIELHIWPTRHWYYDLKTWKEMWVSIHSPKHDAGFQNRKFCQTRI